MKAVVTPGRALRRLGFRQIRRGALIVGLLAGFMMIIQGVAYDAAYTTPQAQADFARTLKSAPALGLIYGSADQLDAGANGYMVYRTAAFLSLIVSVWAVFTTTRLLRGAEDDRRWELVRSGGITNRQATVQVIAGWGTGWLLAFLLQLAFLLTVAVSKLDLGVGTAVVISLVVFLPALAAGMLGLLVSQLAATRQRALLYGLAPIILWFILRGIATVEPGVDWLLYLTPFGWAQLVNPILAPTLGWLLPLGLLPVALAPIGLRFTDRDLEESIIRQQTTARSRLYLLGNSWQLALRQNGILFAAWAFGAMFVIVLVTSLAKLAVSSSETSDSLSKTLGELTNNTNSLQVAFVGVGLMLVVIILLLMATSVAHGVSSDEARQYLDNLLVQPVRRRKWLGSRVLLGASVILVTALAAGLACFIAGVLTGTELEIQKVIATSVCLTGTAYLLLGLGIGIYGLKPRLVGIVMYTVIVWSFVIDLLASLTTLNKVVLQTSLFHYTSFNLAQYPDWATFGWLVLVGSGLAIAGIAAFERRDIVSE